MKFEATSLEGAWLIDLEPKEDDRGYFARTWCRQELAALGLDTEIAQESLSFNRCLGTLRGLHFQRSPHEETKIVRCSRGAVYDVIVDLRPESPSYGLWQGFELTAENRCALYVPKGLAHGFQTLVDDTEIAYQISTPYAPGSAGGYRYDDPVFGVMWPLAVTAISERDLAWPALEGEPGFRPSWRPRAA